MTGDPERGLKRFKPSLAQKTFPQDQEAPAVADHGDGTGQRTRLFLQRIPFHEVLQGMKTKGEYQALETERFIRRHNITTFKPNPFFPVNTLMLMRGAVAAQFENVFERYFRAAYHHMWEEPKKMDDPEVFRRAFASSGIDIDRVIARAQEDDVKKKLIDNTSDAVARGEFGSPTFFVGNEMFFGKDQLRDVEESIVEQTRAALSKTA